ncbi:MAG TPA: hypothetical protein VMT64_11125, partial [Candidatus Binataceae bacterium]|nr:hypothetical protein [Candidatus Binataceae bacterium]
MPRNVAADASVSCTLLITPDSVDSTHNSEQRRRLLLLGSVAAFYLPLIFAGPGSDPDSFRELRSGAILLHAHRYVMSRPPGYFPYELLCGILYALGGTALSNFASLVMSLALLDSFLRVCAHFEVPQRYLLAAAMATHPVYVAASTSTIDFIPALACFFLSYRFLLERRYLLAAVTAAFAIGMRLASILLVVPLFIAELLTRPRDKKLWITCALASAL